MASPADFHPAFHQPPAAAAHSTSVLSPPPSLPPRQPAAGRLAGMPVGGAYYSARPHTVNSRYALSVGESFVAPAAASAAAVAAGYQPTAPAPLYPGALPTDGSFAASPPPAAALYTPASYGGPPGSSFGQPAMPAAPRPGVGVPVGMFNPAAAYQQRQSQMPKHSHNRSRR